jgi:hypothetical protein
MCSADHSCLLSPRQVTAFAQLGVSHYPELSDGTFASVAHLYVPRAFWQCASEAEEEGATKNVRAHGQPHSVVQSVQSVPLPMPGNVLCRSVVLAVPEASHEFRTDWCVAITHNSAMSHLCQ